MSDNIETIEKTPKDQAREKLALAFKPNSPVGAVFVSGQSDADGNVDVLFVNAGAEIPEIITYSFGPAGLFGDSAELVAKDAGVDLNALDEEGFFHMAVRSVGAAACSGTRVPGVSAQSISTRPAMDACKEFAATHPVAHIDAVSLARSKKLAYKIRKATAPVRTPAKEKEADTGLLF